MKELDELRNSGMDNGTLRKSLDLKFAAQMDDVGEIAKFER